MEYPLLPSVWRSRAKCSLLLAVVFAASVGMGIAVMPALPAPRVAGQPQLEVGVGPTTFFFWVAWISGIIGLGVGTTLFGGPRKLWPSPLVPLSARYKFLRTVIWLAFTAAVLLVFTSCAFDRYHQAEATFVRSGENPYVLREHGREYPVSAPVFRRRMWEHSIWLSLFLAPHGLAVCGLAASLLENPKLTTSTRP